MLIFKSILLFLAILSLFIGFIDLITKSFTVLVTKKSKTVELTWWLLSALCFSFLYYISN